MKKHFTLFTLLAVCTAAILPAQDADEILETYFETIGQEQVLKAKSMVSTGKVLQMGMEMPFKMLMKRPGMFRLEVEVQGTQMVQVYDGENGWAIMPFMGSPDPVDVTGPDLKDMEENADMDGKLWNYKEKGSSLEFVGTEDLEGSESYVLKLTSKEGNVDKYYVDAENYVILKSVSKRFVQGSEMEIETLMSNFQEVNGMIMPFTTEQRFGGQMGMTMNLENVEFDLKIDDKIFEKPAAGGSE